MKFGIHMYESVFANVRGVMYFMGNKMLCVFGKIILRQVEKVQLSEINDSSNISRLKTLFSFQREHFCCSGCCYLSV